MMYLSSHLILTKISKADTISHHKEQTEVQARLMGGCGRDERREASDTGFSKPRSQN